LGISFEALFSPAKPKFFDTRRASITRCFAQLSGRCPRVNWTRNQLLRATVGTGRAGHCGRNPLATK